MPCGANETGSWSSGRSRLETRHVSSINDCNILRFVLEVRLEIEPLSTSPVSFSMDEKVGPMYRLLGHLSTVSQKSLLVDDPLV
jgi:hypothetical protein